MYKLNKLLIVFALFNTAACGVFDSKKSSQNSGAGAPVTLQRSPYGTCDRKGVPTTNLCMEAVGEDYNEPGYLGILESSCLSSDGAYSTSTCDTTNAFGVCIIGAGQGNVTYVTYYPPQFSAATAASTCQENNGVYISY